MNSPNAVSSRGLAPAEHCSCLRGLATQWEGAVTKLGKEQYSLSATPPGLLRETYSDHCDGPHSSSPPKGLYTRTRASVLVCHATLGRARVSICLEAGTRAAGGLELLSDVLQQLY